LYCEKRSIPFLSAMNGHEAIAQFEAASQTQDPIDLVLMDLQMPVCGGLEACASIRVTEARMALKPSVIFMITGQDSPNDRTLSTEAGADEFLVKPVSLKLLDRHILRHIPSMSRSFS
jgi:CheY-like chemotaxis protein